MIIDNKDAYDRIRGKLVIATILFSGLIALSTLYDFLPKYFIPMSKLSYAMTFIGFFILFLIYRSNLRYHFIIYNDEEDKIVLRYYPLTTFKSKFISIEIPFNVLYKIETNKKFLNLREELTIYQKVKEGVAKYKPIPLSALTKKEREQLLQALNSHAQVKNNEL